MLRDELFQMKRETNNLKKKECILFEFYLSLVQIVDYFVIHENRKWESILFFLSNPNDMRGYVLNNRKKMTPNREGRSEP